MNAIVKMLTGLLFNVVMGVVLAAVVGVQPACGAAVMVGVGSVMSFVPMPSGILREGVYKEIWTGEVVKTLRGLLAGTWLEGIPDQSSIVDHDTIHLVEVGVDPDVIINNKTYPIPHQVLDDDDIAIKLDKFTTKVTPVTDDELYAISYDKMGRVKESHGHAIADAKFAKAAHALCAQSDTEKTPVLSTTGEIDPATGRRRMTIKDLVALKAALDNLGVPDSERRLVLCSDHCNDLLLVSQSFQQQFNIDRNTGKIGMLMGFEIYTYGNTPVYTAAGEKKAVFAKADEGVFKCSFAFYKPRVFKATGSTKMYYRPAETDPEYQRNLINFTHRFIVMPKKADAGAVMMSAYGSDAAEIAAINEIEPVAPAMAAEEIAGEEKPEAAE